MKDKFWKISVIIFLLWLFLWLWNSMIYVDLVLERRFVKINKLTGQAWILTIDGWQNYFKKK